MTDAELLERAVVSSGCDSYRGFAIGVLGLDASNARKVRRGDKALGRSSRILCMLIIQRPELVDAIAGALTAVTEAATEVMSRPKRRTADPKARRWCVGNDR